VPPTVTPTPHIDKSPPKINNLSWQPLTVVNGKVYDGRVSFEAKDDSSPIAYAELKFVPIRYKHLSPDAFPEEATREIILEPSDGVFDELKEEFAVDVKDIIGGREYVVEAVVEDRDGNVSVERIKTPYIREFENLGKLLYDKGIIVGATCYPLYPDPHPWEWLEPMAVHPLLRKYDVRDPIVIAKHIDWASGHGINCLFLDYGIFIEDEPNERIFRNIKIIFENGLAEDIYFSVMYELPARARRASLIVDEELKYDDDEDLDKLQIILKDFKKLSSFFVEDNFLKLGKKPVIYIYEGQGVRGDVEAFFNRIRDAVKEECSMMPYLIVDYATPLSVSPWQPCPTDPQRLKRALNVEGWTAWWAGYYLDRPEREYFGDNFPAYVENGYKIWNMLAKENNKDFITSVLPGWVDLRHPESHVPLPRNITRFEELVKIALTYSISPAGSFLRFIRCDTYNE
jgi:hypothetical protein